jgi:hypothetical protein
MRVRDMKFHDRFLSLLLSQLHITSHSDADALIAALVVIKNVDNNGPYDFSNVCADSHGNSRTHSCTLNTILVRLPCCRTHNSSVLCPALLEHQARIQVKQTVLL